MTIPKTAQAAGDVELLERLRAERDTRNKELEPLVEARLQERMGDARLSTMQKRLKKMRERSKKPLVEKITIGEDEEAEDWFVRSISLPQLREIMFRCSRDADGNIQIDTSEEYGSFMAAVLFVCLAKNETDVKASLFEQDEDGWRDASEMANDETDTVSETNSMLLAACLLKNPQIFPELAREFEELARAGESNFLASPPQETSTTLPESNVSTGSNETAPTNLPFSPPTDSSQATVDSSAT